MGQSIEKKDNMRDKLIVLPLRPEQGQPYEGLGLGIHFLLGNVMATHTGLKEFWFGWRVKKIFHNKENLITYCGGNDPQLDIVKLGKEQGVRYWIQGKIKPQGSRILTSLALTDTKGEGEEWKTDLVMDPADQLIEFRKDFLAWLDTCGLSFPDEQLSKALWQEKTTLKSLDLLGRDLATYYLHSSWGDTDPLDSDLFDSAISAAPFSYLAHDLKGWVLYKNKDYQSAEDSFGSAVKLNSTGLGAISGLMWCGVYTQDKDKAEKWAVAKAEIRGESREKARADVKKRMEKAIQ